MATIMQMHWPEATEEQYEQVRRTADWEGNRPEGAKLHVVGFAGDGMRILDIWESADAFQVWFEQRIGPAVEAAGIDGRPDVLMFPLHGVYAPAFGREEQTATP
jgi:heme-degrading monooxygenase HmoA